MGEIEFDKCESIFGELNSNEITSHTNEKAEIIYVNCNELQPNEIYSTGSNNSVPVGRKPALPPKPPNPLRLSLVKTMRNSSITIANNKKSTTQNKKDPAELSLRERLALFEKNKSSVLVPKSSLKTTTQTKTQPINVIPNINGHTTSPHVSHTSALLKTIHSQKTIICGKRLSLKLFV